MSFFRSRPRRASQLPVGHTGDRSRQPLRLLSAVLIGTVAAVLVAGCGSGGSTGTANAGSPRAGGQPVTARGALVLAAAQAQKVDSFTATIDIASSGSLTSHLTGTLQERVRPALLSHQSLKASGSGAALPGGLQTLLTSHAIYVKLSTLAATTGKPWVKLPFASLKKGLGISLAPLVRQLQTSNPLAETQMLAAASNVSRAGSQTINGVPATEYTGTLDVEKAVTRLDPSLRKLVGAALSATGIKTASFRVWIDGQHQVRKLVESEGGPKYHVTSTIVITSINQPVDIAVPPPGQVGTLPGF